MARGLCASYIQAQDKYSRLPADSSNYAHSLRLVWLLGNAVSFSASLACRGCCDFDDGGQDAFSRVQSMVSTVQDVAMLVLHACWSARLQRMAPVEIGDTQSAGDLSSNSFINCQVVGPTMTI